MVKVIPKEEVVEKESKLVIAVFWFSFLIFVLVAGLFFLFDWQTKKATLSLAEVEEELADIGTPEQLALKASVYGYKQKIDDAFILLKQHGAPTKIFDLLGKGVLDEVRFSSIQFTTKENTVDLSGDAQNMLSLAQQILIIESNPEVQNVHLSMAGISKDGGIEFDLEIKLTPNALSMK